MAQTILGRFTLTATYGSGYDAGDQVEIRHDFFESPELSVYVDTLGNGIFAERTGGPLIPLAENDSLVVTGILGYYEPQICNPTNDKLATWRGGVNFPYAIKSENDSLLCSGETETLEWDTLSITDASSTSAADGEFTVSATTTASGDVRYSLDPLTYPIATNTSGNFTGLVKGTYTVYAYDSVGNIITQTVVIGGIGTEPPTPPAPEPVKYRSEWVSWNGDSFRIDVTEKDYTGAIVDIPKMDGGSPLTLEMTTISRQEIQKLSPLKATRAVARFTVQSEGKMREIFGADEDKHKLKIYKNDSLIWQGSILTDTWIEPWLEPPYNVELVATDGVQKLNDLPYEKTGTAGIYDFSLGDGNKQFFGTEKLIKIIARMLQFTGLEQSIRVGVNLYETNHATTAADDPLDQTYISNDVFYEIDESKTIALLGNVIKERKSRNIGESLREILLTFGARLINWGGYWYILRVEELYSTIDYREFDYTGDYSSNGTLSDVVQQIARSSTSNRLVWKGRSQSFRGLQAYNEINIRTQWQQDEFKIKNGGFEIWDFQFNALTGEFENILQSWGRQVINPDNESLQYEYRRISVGRRGSTFALEVSGALSAGFFLSGDPKFTTGNSYAIAKSTAISVEYTSTDSFRISFEYNVNVGTGDLSTGDPVPDSVDVRFAVLVVDGGTTYYLQDSGGWSTSSSFVTISVDKDEFGRWIEHEVIIGAPGVTGTIDGSAQLWLYGPENTDDTKEYIQGIIYDNSDLVHLPSGEQIPDESLTTRIGNPGSSFTPDDIILRFGDIPDIRNAKNIYNNSYRLSNGNKTTTWARDSVGESERLQSILTKVIISFYQEVTREFSGNGIFDFDIKFYNSFIDSVNLPGVTLIIDTMTIDFQRSECNVTLLEIPGTADGAPAFSSGFTTGFGASGFD